MLHTAVPAAAVGAALFVLLMLNIEADRCAVVQMIRIMVLTSGWAGRRQDIHRLSAAAHTAWFLKGISSNSISRKLVRHAAQRSCDTLCAAFVCLRETQKIRPEKYKSAQDILSIWRRRSNVFAGGMGRLKNFGLVCFQEMVLCVILCQARKF